MNKKGFTPEFVGDKILDYIVNQDFPDDVEDDGFWIESPPLIGQISANEAWTPHVEHIQAPVVFVLRV